MTAWKFREQKAAARIQAVVGRWTKKWPPVTDTGRVGHLGPQQAPIDIDFLADGVGGESKSSTRKAKNPGYRINKDDINKLLRGIKDLEEEFGVTLIPALAVSIAHADDTIVGTSEKWFLRLLVAYEGYLDATTGYGKYLTEGQVIEQLDEEIERRFEGMSKRYR